MPRTLALALLVVVSAVGVSAPVPKALKKPTAPPVVNTSWTGTNGNDTTYDYTFHPDGAFSAEQNGRPYSKGTWKQEGETLEWEFNNRYSVYTVTFQDGLFVGRAVNVKGKSWEVTLKPFPK